MDTVNPNNGHSRASVVVDSTQIPSENEGQYETGDSTGVIGGGNGLQ